MKKIGKYLGSLCTLVLLMAGCSGGATNQNISVISREDGSGTRGAFIELFNIEEKNSAGDKVDNTTVDAMITNSTSVMLTSVAEDKNAIGYVSLGSLNDTVKAVKIDGVEPTVANINNKSYKIARPFNIATKDTSNEVANDFINFIMSSDGKTVIEDNKYISVSSQEFTSAMPSGKVTIAGSSSITPVMEKLKEAYLAINANATIEIQQSDSTTGMNSVIDGIADIGMASREVKDSEQSQGLTVTTIAMDGIAVVINKDNSISEISSENVKEIFVGNKTSWEEVK